MLKLFFFYVMGKALTGELSCLVTGLVSGSFSVLWKLPRLCPNYIDSQAGMGLCQLYNALGTLLCVTAQ